jgi:N-acetylmuramoyl-L-alanine amidase
MPAILIEHGFYTNVSEVEYLKSDAFRDRLAQSDAQGILNFFSIFR